MVIGHGDGWAARGRWLFHVFHVFLTICFLLTQIDILVDIPTKDRNIELKISTNNFASERALQLIFFSSSCVGDSPYVENVPGWRYRRFFGELVEAKKKETSLPRSFF
jgi:hypothetical protein